MAEDAPPPRPRLLESQFEDPTAEELRPPRPGSSAARTRDSYPAFEAPPPRDRLGRRMVLGVILAGALALWLGLFSLAQLTSDEVARPATARIVAVLVEVDGLLQLHDADLRAQFDRGEGLVPSGYPVAGVSVPPAQVRGADGGYDRARLRSALLDRSAVVVRSRGLDAFHPAADEGDTAFSAGTSGAALLIDFLGDDLHGFFVLLLWPLGIFAALLGLLFLALSPGMRKFTGLGLVLVGAALPVLAVGAAAWSLAPGIGGDGVLGNTLTEVTRSLVWLPLRNGLLVGGAGLLLALTAWVTARRLARAERRYRDAEDYEA